MNTTLGSNIRERLSELGITQSELAHLVGCKPAHISDVVKGRSSMSLEMAVKTSEALHCSLDWLVGRTSPLIRG